MMSVFEDGTTLGLYRDREKSCAEIAKFSNKDAETYHWLATKAAVGGIAFAVLGINAVGTALVWLPAAIYLILTGQIIGGIALILIGVFVIGLVYDLRTRRRQPDSLTSADSCRSGFLQESKRG